MEDKTVKIGTLAIALYAAIVATSSLIWQVITAWLRARGTLIVSVADHMMIIQRSGEEGPYLIVKAVNDGPKPITVNHIGIRVRRPPLAFVITGSEPPLPANLAEGQEVYRMTLREDLICSLKKKANNSGPWKCIAIVGTTSGRQYTKKFLFPQVQGTVPMKYWQFWKWKWQFRKGSANSGDTREFRGSHT